MAGAAPRDCSRSPHRPPAGLPRPQAQHRAGGRHGILQAGTDLRDRAPRSTQGCQTVTPSATSTSTSRGRRHRHLSLVVLAQLEAFSSSPMSCYLGKKTDTHLSPTSFQVGAESDEVPPILHPRLPGERPAGEVPGVWRRGAVPQSLPQGQPQPRRSRAPPGTGRAEGQPGARRAHNRELVQPRGGTASAGPARLLGQPPSPARPRAHLPPGHRRHRSLRRLRLLPLLPFFPSLPLPSSSSSRRAPGAASRETPRAGVPAGPRRRRSARQGAAPAPPAPEGGKGGGCGAAARGAENPPGIRTDGQELEREIHLNMRKSCFPWRWAEHLNRAARAGAESPSPEIAQSHLDAPVSPVLGDLSMAGSLTG